MGVVNSKGRTTVCMREQKLELNESLNTGSNEND